MLADWYWYNVHEPNICPLSHIALNCCCRCCCYFLLFFHFQFPLICSLLIHSHSVSLFPSHPLPWSSSFIVCYEFGVYVCMIWVFIFMFILWRHPKTMLFRHPHALLPVLRPKFFSFCPCVCVCVYMCFDNKYDLSHHQILNTHTHTCIRCFQFFLHSISILLTEAHNWLDGVHAFSLIEANMLLNPDFPFGNSQAKA